MCVTPMENPMCVAFEEYKEATKTAPLDFLEDDVMWVVSKLSGAAGALRYEAIELSNWLLCFGCASWDFRIVLTNLADWISNSPTPWAAYHAMLACRLVAMDKRPGVRL